LKREVKGILYQSALVAFEALELHRLVASLHQQPGEQVGEHCLMNILAEVFMP